MRTGMDWTTANLGGAKVDLTNKSARPCGPGAYGSGGHQISNAEQRAERQGRRDPV